MKPRQKDEGPLSPDAATLPAAAVPRTSTFRWLVAGGETARVLEEEVSGEEAPTAPAAAAEQVAGDHHGRTATYIAGLAGVASGSGTEVAIDPRTPLHRAPAGRFPPPLPDPSHSTARRSAASPAPSSSSSPAILGGAVEPGSRIGQYEVIRELGRGGMGMVFLARDDRLGRRVAIKFLQTGDAELTSRFIVEARATARCSHENIVVIYEVGELAGSPFMVLEYLAGQTLGAVIKKSAPIPHTRVAELTASVVRALACAHEQGIVHRDLKPENIFLTDAGTVKVLDFGVAKVLRDESRGPDSQYDPGRGVAPAPFGAGLGGGTGIVGTMAYMSPEQWGVGGEIDHRTDIWATGIVLFQMLAGFHPLEAVGPNPIPWVTNLKLPMPSLRDAAPQVPKELADIVDACLRKRKEERLSDARALLRALEPFLPGRFKSGPLPIEHGPYAGLRAFREEDAGRFFGRAREVAALVTRIRDFPLMATVGPSGIGKSSFVRAGLLPALKGSGERWETLVLRPGRDPLLALAAAMSPIVATSSSLVDDLGAHKELAKRLEAEHGYLGSSLRGAARRTGHRYLLFVDQFEELYTLGGDPLARRAFTACLAAAADDATSPVRVIVSIRADFLGRVAEDPHFMNELAKGLFFLSSPSSEGLRDAIVQPAEIAGYRFESTAMIDEMLEHLEATPGALPLLQFTASQLWESRDPARKLLTEQSYRALGGIAGALVSHADRVIANLSAESQALARALFVHLVTPERTRAVRDLNELRETVADHADLDRLIDDLVESRLLVVQTSGAGDGATVEIIHESLIATWPALKKWLDESHEDSVFLEQLRAAARQWQSKKRDSGLLWGGEMGEELERFRRRYRGELSDVAQAFSDAVLAQRDRSARRRRALFVGGTSLVVALLAAASVALVIISNARQGAERNAAAATLAEADAQRRLREVEAKERERLQAESLRRAAETQAARANSQVELTKDQLAAKNVELTYALTIAKEQRQRAQLAAVQAAEDEKTARDAEERARKTAEQLEELLKKERERADRLNSQLGSPLVEQLQ